jgi:hypothetical protein
MTSNNESEHAGPVPPRSLSGAAAATGALVVGFWMPPRASGAGLQSGGRHVGGRARRQGVNAWVVVAPDEHGDDPHRPDRARPGGVDLQRHDGVPRSCNATGARSGRNMRPPIATARNGAPTGPSSVMGKWRHRSARWRRAGLRNARSARHRGYPDTLYRRMRTNAAASVRDGRYYLQLAGAEGARATACWRLRDPGACRCQR